MSEPGPGGNFDYLWEDLAPEPPRGGFDNFDLDDWNFKPAVVPWYRTRGAAVALIAAGLAAAALVVSGVLLLFRDSPSGESTETTTTSPTATTTSPSPEPPLRVGVLPPPAEPPPPPPEETQQAPVYRPTHRPSPTKKPEIGVTRTPVTRSPISVAPQPRHPH